MEKNKFIIIGIWVLVAIIIVYLVFSLVLANRNKEEDKPIPTQNTAVEEQVAPENAVAQIDSRYYTSIQSAIDNVKNDGYEKTIKVLKSTRENLSIEENKNIILECNDCTITSLDYMAPAITVAGKLIVKNANVVGECKSKVPSINISRSGQLSLESSNVNRKSNAEFANETISVNGILNVNSGRIVNERSSTIYLYSGDNVEANISGDAEIYSKQDSAIINSSKAKITIQGGKFECGGANILVNQNDAIMTINGGSINTEINRAIDNSGTLNIGGTADISSLDKQTIYNQNTGIIVVTGGMIKSQSAITIANKQNGQITISGGIISSETGNAINNEGNLTINQGANIISNGESSPTIYNQNSGNIVVNGGIVQNKSSNYDIYNNQGHIKDDSKIISKHNWN